MGSSTLAREASGFPGTQSHPPDRAVVPAECRLFLEDQDVCARMMGRDRRGHSGGAGTDHQHIANGCLHIVSLFSAGIPFSNLDRPPLPSQTEKPEEVRFGKDGTTLVLNGR